MADRQQSDIESALDLFIGDTPAEKEGTTKPRERNPNAVGERSKRRNEQSKSSQTPTKKKEPATNETATPVQTRTRMGRPPGSKSGEGRPKSKTSLALDPDLMDRYRKQTWKEEVQFGELIERALRDYASRTWGWGLRAPDPLSDNDEPTEQPRRKIGESAETRNDETE